MTQVQKLALGLVELHEVHMGLPLKPVSVPLDDVLSFSKLFGTNIIEAQTFLL